MIASIPRYPVSKTTWKTKKVITHTNRTIHGTPKVEKAQITAFVENAEKSGNDDYSNCIKRCLADGSGGYEMRGLLDYQNYTEIKVSISFCLTISN